MNDIAVLEVELQQSRARVQSLLEAADVRLTEVRRLHVCVRQLELQRDAIALGVLEMTTSHDHCVARLEACYRQRPALLSPGGNVLLAAPQTIGNLADVAEALRKWSNPGTPLWIMANNALNGRSAR